MFPDGPLDHQNPNFRERPGGVTYDQRASERNHSTAQPVQSWKFVTMYEGCTMIVARRS